MSMLCNNNRVCWVVFHFIKMLHSKHLSSFLQNFSMHRFRCGKQYTVQKPITRSLNNNFSLESTPSRIFLLSFYFFFIFYFLNFFYFYYHVQLQKIAIFQALFIPGFIFLLSMREQKFISTLNSVKNVAIQILGRGPN